MDDKIQITFEEYKNVLVMILSGEDNRDLIVGVIMSLDISDELNSDMRTILRLCNFLYSLRSPFHEINFGNTVKNIFYNFHYVNVELNADLSFLKAYMKQNPVSSYISQSNTQDKEKKYIKDFFQGKYSL